jgi:hypothetical protein
MESLFEVYFNEQSVDSYQFCHNEVRKVLSNTHMSNVIREITDSQNLSVSCFAKASFTNSKDSNTHFGIESYHKNLGH